MDKMQLMVKRMSYTLYLWMDRLILTEVMLTILTVMLVIPLVVFAASHLIYIRRVLNRRRAFWENPKKLQDEIDAKVEAYAKKAMAKQHKAQEEQIKRAKEVLNKMKNM